MATDSTHFVKYRMKDEVLGDHYITFSSRTHKEPLWPDDHPLIQKIAENSPDIAAKAHRLMQDMIAQEKTFFAWLGASAANMELFMEYPVNALKQGAPDLPESFYVELDSLPKIYAKKR